MQQQLVVKDSSLPRQTDVQQVGVLAVCEG